MERSKKFESVGSIKKDFEEVKTVFAIHYHGLSVLDISNLRKSLRNSGGKIIVAKNTLAKIAISETSYQDLDVHLKGPIALLFSNDPISVAKILVSFGKTNEKMQIVAGFMDGKVLNHDDVNKLALIPSLEESRAQLVSIIGGAASNLVNVLKHFSSSLESADEHI